MARLTPDEMERAEQLVQSAHAVIKDLRQVLKEAAEERERIEKAVKEAVHADAMEVFTEYMDALGLKLRVSMKKAEDHVIAEFEDLLNRLMAVTKSATTPKADLRDLPDLLEMAARAENVDDVDYIMATLPPEQVFDYQAPPPRRIRRMKAKGGK